MADEKQLQEAGVELVARIDPDDIVRALGDNDGMILTFVCQMVALAHSSELREQLLSRLGVTLGDRHASGGRHVTYDETAWEDSEYV